MKKILLLLLSTIVLLQACVPAVLVGGGAVIGATIIHDNRSIKTMFYDRDISYKIQKAINTDPALKNKTHISVATFNHIVLLVGQAPTPALRARSVAIAKSFTKLNIKRIYNQITIAAPSATLVQSNDAIITAKVKTQMLMRKSLQSNQMKIITENGIVYLMGLTTPQQGELAAEVARKVGGAQKVVKVFEYIKK